VSGHAASRIDAFWKDAGFLPTRQDGFGFANQHPARRGGGKDAAKFDEVLVKARALLV
jgi:hypothetical protein